MEICDNTIDKIFREIHSGDCFVMYSTYYMKIRVPYLNDYNNIEDYKYLALNLATGFATSVEEEEKVRLINTRLLVY